MKAAPADDDDGLIADAQRLRRELIRAGKCTLKSGLVLEPKVETLIKVIQDTANLKKPKKRVVTNVDDFRIKRTT